MKNLFMVIYLTCLLMKKMQQLQMRGSFIKQYYWEVRQFSQCDSDRFNEMTKIVQNTLYIYKRNVTDVFKIHGWTIREIEVFTKLNDNPKVFHWKTVKIPFKGELILSLLPDLNVKLQQQIEQAFPRKSQGLKRWLQQQINDVIMIKSRSAQSFGFEHQYLQVRTVYRTRYINYFETKCWKSQSWQNLLVIAQIEKIQANSSFGTLLQQIYNFICKFQVIKDSKYQDMFTSHPKKKTVKERPKDTYQTNYQNQIMKKYNLYEYIEQ